MQIFSVSGNTRKSNFKVFCSKILLRDHFLFTWKKKYSDFCEPFSIYWSEFEITDTSISLRRIVVGLQPFFPLKYLKQAQKYFYVETITFHFFVFYLAKKRDDQKYFMKRDWPQRAHCNSLPVGSVAIDTTNSRLKPFRENRWSHRCFSSHYFLNNIVLQLWHSYYARHNKYLGMG